MNISEYVKNTGDVVYALKEVLRSLEGIPDNYTYETEVFFEDNEPRFNIVVRRNKL